MKYKLQTNYKKILADTITPVSIYLKVRDAFPNSILLESSDYHGNENSFSYVCCNPIASISVKDQNVSETFPDGKSDTTHCKTANEIPGMIHEFSQKFETENQKFKFINNGLFGYIGYDAVKYFEDIEIAKKQDDLEIPDIYYAVYQNIIAINHFKNEAYIFSHSYDQSNNIEEIHQLIGNRNFASYTYQNADDEKSSLSDDEFMEHVELAKKHCFRGDVFQLERICQLIPVTSVRPEGHAATRPSQHCVRLVVWPGHSTRAHLRHEVRHRLTRSASPKTHQQADLSSQRHVARSTLDQAIKILPADHELAEAARAILPTLADG